MALECGEVMHQVFATVRIWQLLNGQKKPDHAHVTGECIFGKGRWREILKSAKSRDQRENLLEMAFTTLHTSAWVDGEYDKTRTMQNMELSTLCYVDERLPHMNSWPIYIERSDPNSMVGIEQHFDVVLEFVDGKVIRYIGTIDGLVYDIGIEGSPLTLDENKTSVRLDTGWREKFKMAHQLTGYNAASTSVFKFPVMRSRIAGLKIKPAGRGDDYWDGKERRDIEAMFRWAHWLRYTEELFSRYRDDWEWAPRFTHSCNRFFRPCSLLSFCADSPSGRREQWDQMVPADPSPSERAVSE